MIHPESIELQDLVRDLHQQATPWLPAGLGSRLHWGPAVTPSCRVVSSARLDRIVEHNPGDFTVTAEAGLPLDELQRSLARSHQWLAVDAPWGRGAEGGSAGSVGGLVARGLAGGYRQRYLGIRDQLIGIRLVRADGVAARAGGKVVKNVAGYDLMRLFTGSWGSLGLITEVTLRTMPLPPQRRGLLVQGPLASLAALNRWLLGSSLTPERIDWWTAPLAAAAGQPAEPALLIALASVNALTLEEQVACIAERTPLPCRLLEAEELEHLLRRPREGASGADAPVAWLLRPGVDPDRADSLLAEPSLAGLPLELAAGSGIGLAWAGAELAPERVSELRRRCRSLGGYLTVLRQPLPYSLPCWEDAPSRPLIEAIKRRFDPSGQLAPGRLPGVSTAA